MTAPIDDPELRLLCALITAAPDGPTLRAAACGADWARLQSVSARHRVDGLVHATLTRWPGLAPDAVAQSFAARAQRQTMRALHQVKLLTELLPLFDAAGIEVMVLKGPVLARRFYDSLGQRQTFDLDLLIRPEDVDAAHAQMQGARFELPDEDDLPENGRDMRLHLKADFQYTRVADGAVVDLQVRPSGNARLLSWRADQMFAVSDQDQSFPVPVTTLRDVEHLFYVIVHGAKYGWFRLKWLMDMDHMLRRCALQDLDRLPELARLSGTTRMLATSLRLRRMLMGPGPGDDLMHEREVDPVLLRLMLRCIIDDPAPVVARPGDLPGVLMRFRMGMRLRPGLGYKLQAFEQRVVQRSDIAALGLSLRWRWVYWMMAPFRRMRGLFRPRDRSV